MKSKAKLLAKYLGGKWTYDGAATWHCDDGDRRVQRTCCEARNAQGVALCDAGICPGQQFWLYGTGGPRNLGMAWLSVGKLHELTAGHSNG